MLGFSFPVMEHNFPEEQNPQNAQQSLEENGW
jgi:hypothetical protein